MITKTETRGPYSRPYTVYFIHTKTAFCVRGVCKRFSEFKEFDAKIRANFPNASLNLDFPSDQLFSALRPDVVGERRRQLQSFLDGVMEVAGVERFEGLHEFLGIPEYLEELEKESLVQRKPDLQQPNGILGACEAEMLKVAMTGSDLEDASALNNLGVAYCEACRLEEGVACLKRSLELCQAEGMPSESGQALVLSNLGCLHNMLDEPSDAIASLLRCRDLVAGDVKAEGEVQMYLSLTYAANGDNYEAIERCLKCLRLCRLTDNLQQEASCLFALGCIYYEAGEVRQAVEAFEQCLVLRRKTRDKIGLAEALDKLGLTYCDIGYDLRAIDYFEQSLAICEDCADLLGQAVCLQHLGNVFKMQKDNFLAIEFFERCLEVRKKVGDKAGIADCYESMAFVYAGLGPGYLETASQLYRSASELYSILNDPCAESECCKNLGTAYFSAKQANLGIPELERCLSLQRQHFSSNEGVEVDTLACLGLAHFNNGDHEMAIRYMEESLRRIDCLSVALASTLSGKTVLLDHTGNMYSQMGRPERALVYYTMSLRVKKDIGDLTGEARCLVRIGLEFSRCQELHRAFDAFTEALHTFERLEDDQGISICYENLGDTYMQMGELRQAIFSYDRCLPIKVETWDKIGEAQCLDNLALAHFVLGELHLATYYYEQALLLWKMEEDNDCLLKNCEKLGTIHFLLGEHSSSIERNLQCIQILQQTKRGVSKVPSVLVRLGLSHEAIQNYAESLSFLRQALSLFEDVGDLKNAAMYLQHIGAGERSLGHLDCAQVSLERSLSLRKQLQDMKGQADSLNEIGFLFHLKGQQLEALRFLEQAKDIFTDVGDQAALATCVLHIGAAFAAVDDHTQAIQQFKTALILGHDAIGGWSGKGPCLDHLASSQAKNGDTSAIKSFHLALRIWQEAGSQTNEAALLMQLARAQIVLEGPKSAIDILKQALELYRSVGNMSEQIYALSALACLYISTGNTLAAVDVANECFILQEKNGNGHSLAAAECLLGATQVANGSAVEGVWHLSKAAETWHTIGCHKKEAESLNNLGVARAASLDWAGAAAEFRKALHLPVPGDGQTEQYVLLNLGIVQAHCGELAASIVTLEAALSIVHDQDKVQPELEGAILLNIVATKVAATLDVKPGPDVVDQMSCTLQTLRKQKNRICEARALHAMGAIFFHRGETNEAKVHFEEALNLSNSLEDQEVPLKCHLALYASHIRLGNAFSAAKYAYKAMELRRMCRTTAHPSWLEEQLDILQRAAVGGDSGARAAAVHMKLGDYYVESEPVLAANHYQKAMRRLQKLGDYIGEAVCRARLAEMMQIEGAFEDAILEFRGAAVLIGNIGALAKDDTQYSGGKRGKRRLIAVARILEGLGGALLASGRFMEACTTLERHLEVAKALGDRTAMFDTCNRLGIAYLRAGDVKLAINRLQGGLGGADLGEKEIPGRIVGLNCLVSTLEAVNQYQAVLRLINQHECSLMVLKTRGDLLGEATCHFLLGEAYSRICRPGRAHAAFSACRRLREQIASSAGTRDNGAIANALCKEGVAAYLCGEFPAATRALIALVTNYAPVQAHGDITLAASATAHDVVDANKTLGLAQLAVGNVAGAAEALGQALALAVRVNSKLLEARVTAAFGEMYSKLHIPGRALHYYEKAGIHFSRAGCTADVARCTLEIGKLQFLRGETTLALECYERSLREAVSEGMGKIEADTTLQMGYVHAVQGNHAQARAYFERAGRIAREHLDPAGEAEGLIAAAKSTVELCGSLVATEMLLQAQGIMQEIGDRSGETRCLIELSRVQFQGSHFPEAVKFAKEAKRVASENDDLVGCCSADIAHGRAHIGRNDWAAADAALSSVRKILTTRVQLDGSMVYLDPVALVECLCLLASLAHLRRCSNAYKINSESSIFEALELYKQAEMIASTTEDVCCLAAIHLEAAAIVLLVGPGSGSSTQLAEEELRILLSQADHGAQAYLAHGNRGGLARCSLVQGALLCSSSSSSDIERGVARVRGALELFCELGSARGMADAHMTLGHASEGSDGIFHYDEALRIRRQVSDRLGVITCLLCIAEVLQRHDKNAEAVQFLQDAQETALSVDNAELNFDCFLRLCHALVTIGKISEARYKAEQLLAFIHDYAASAAVASRGEDDPAVATALAQCLLILGKLDMVNVDGLQTIDLEKAAEHFEQCIAKAKRTETHIALLCMQDASNLLSQLQQIPKTSKSRAWKANQAIF